MANSIELWPPVFPAPTLGAQFTDGQNRQQGSDDIAPAIVVFDNNYRESGPVMFTMSCDQFELFRSWYRYRLFNGCGAFQTNWCGKKAITRFTDGWSASRTDVDRYELAATVEIDYSCP